MATLTTNGVQISVESFYLFNQSQPSIGKHLFSYRVVIKNMSNQTIQLMRRHWHIVEAGGFEREVEGEGVIGQQPILKPGESHEYDSWCPLRTNIGKMYGTFLMVSKEDNHSFYVKIPHFQLVAEYVLN